jgi:uncharacterized membrane protein YuzA (DUF378 family)
MSNILNKKTTSDLKPTLSKMCYFISAIGALNWGSIGLFELNFVEFLIAPHRARWVYLIVGISGIFVLIDLLGPFFSNQGGRKIGQ